MFSKEATQLRLRKRAATTSEISDLMNRHLLPFKRLSKRTKFYLLIACVLLPLCVYYTTYHIFGNHLTEENFLETHKCPACYGTSLCRELFSGALNLKGSSKLRALDIINIKNVHFANFETRDVVLKKLGSDIELRKLDEHICRDANKPSDCNVGKAVHLASYYKPFSEELDLTPNSTRYLNEIFTCPSNRLLKRLKKAYKEKSAEDRLLYRDKIMLLTTVRLNPEPIVIQIFPQSEGWPFPEYFGACGRFVVQSYEGKTLDTFYDAPFSKRVDIAYQIMKMAALLSENKYQFALYWTDLQWENFAVNDAGKVTFIDVENIVIVDKLSIKKERKESWDVYHHSSHEACSDPSKTNCITYSPDELCKHADSDHNFYVACTSVLAPEGADKSTGLLHDMPDYARDNWELQHLLQECVSPSRYKGRQHAKDQLLLTLKKLKSVTLEEKPELHSEHFQQ